jgi:hypothetical protein
MPARCPGITKVGIERKLGMSRQTVWRVVKRLHDTKQCHIGGWHRLKAGGPFNPRYVAGPGVDVVCTLEKLPQSVTQKRWKEKALLDGRYALRSEKIKLKYRRKKAQSNAWLSQLLAVPRAYY